MSDFRLIALALWLTAACQVYDRVPWRKCWGWLTAKALALRSWWLTPDPFPRNGFGDPGFKAPVIDGVDGEWSPSRYDETRRTVHSEGCPRSEFGICSCASTSEPALPDPYEPLVTPRRRPSRASAAKARKAKK